MPSNAIALRADRALTPAMTAMVWEIAGALDAARVPIDPQDAVWLAIPTVQLRGEGGRTDNVWLRECLDRLTGVKLSGEYKGDPWGAVVLAEWRIEEGGALAKLLIPPAGVHALRVPSTFTKIEADAAHRLTGHGRQLYALLADKKRLGRPFWTFGLDELRSLMGVDEKRAYKVWAQFRKRVLDPAVEAVNAYGTVEVSMTPIKTSRSVTSVRFDWRWKDPRSAVDTTRENERHSGVRGSIQTHDDAPPMIEDLPEPALDWWGGLTDAERETWSDRVGRSFDAAGMTVARREADIARAAFAASNAETETGDEG